MPLPTSPVPPVTSTRRFPARADKSTIRGHFARDSGARAVAHTTTELFPPLFAPCTFQPFVAFELVFVGEYSAHRSFVLQRRVWIKRPVPQRASRSVRKRAFSTVHVEICRRLPRQTDCLPDRSCDGWSESVLSVSFRVSEHVYQTCVAAVTSGRDEAINASWSNQRSRGWLWEQSSPMAAAADALLQPPLATNQAGAHRTGRHWPTTTDILPNPSAAEPVALP
eukprot:scaffold888_cov246-Pinguiococcus_pyrenoidosus.AAC.4